MKPFRVPSIIRKSSEGIERPSLNASGEPPTKKRRISDEDLTIDNVAPVAPAAQVLNRPKSVGTFRNPMVRQPLSVVKNPAAESSQQPAASYGGAETYYAVLWRKFTTKKNKTWDGDGVLALSGGYATLQDVSGKLFGRTACKGPLLVGSELSISGREVEVDSMIPKEDFLAGRPFLGGNTKPRPAPAPLSTKHDGVSKAANKAPETYEKNAATQPVRPFVPVSASKGTKAAFKTPMINGTVHIPPQATNLPVPRHDPGAEGALIMKRPKNVPRGKQIVDVVVDPLLTKNLREHQRAGVAFMYECVMGMKGFDGEGVILADEMGLGKTLQTIALLWTLLKQNPIHGDAPVIKKALIVCPVTLINNWRKEFRKWLGKERIGVFVAENKKARLTDFTMGKSYSVMIIGYEKLRMVQADLQKGAGIDIVIADEGHRLKTAQNKSALAIKSLNTERRVILSGTPIQNDLTEFYTMVDFVNPGLLNKYTTFKREFETPILKSRQPGASEKELEKGEARSEELANITGMFILRRTAEILSKYLPSKTEYVVFCRPTKVQRKVYHAITGSPMFNAALGGSSVSLELINVLKKVCNSPNLLLKKNNKGDDITKPELIACIPHGLLKSPGASGKLQVLDSLLHQIRTTSEEKVVLVSNYTSTLDVLGNLLHSLSYKFMRLDGSIPAHKRQDLVDTFNRAPPSHSFVFLLSAKAGGTGLNLIGASRLVLFDIDWNPATDLQAMARVHRDGQKLPCYIYRFLTQGAIDEKIFQRQVSKTGLADSIVDGKGSVSGFSREELRDLFTLDESSDCQTHKILGCACNGTGIIAPDPHNESPSPRNDLALLSRGSEVEEIHLDQDSDDEPLRPKADFMPGSQVDWQGQEAEVQRKAKECKDSTGKAKMLSLMRYAHFDTALIRSEEVSNSTMDESLEEDPLDGRDGGMLESAIVDEALRTVLKEDGQRVGYVFTKTSASD